ncbi:MAG: hypothetical protein Greene041619_299 [Candidatus Peregrinibacteria bacterium Greene0416_19]|nr:MAG: hypothetical protein Greene041619_299 [Candidatus Peregrinibacteria bacterium Greene0416_19]
MSDLPTDSPTPAVPSGILDRIALPMFLFSLTLLALLAAADFFVLPSLAQVDVAGTVYPAEELPARRASLFTGIEELRRQRDERLLPLRHPSYDRLKEERASRPSFDTLRAQVERQVAAVSPEPGVVAVHRMQFAPAEKQLILSGDVRKVGTRSMTVLSQFVDIISRMPLAVRGPEGPSGPEWAASVSQPRFERVAGPDGPHSPFTFSVTLP